MPIGKGQMEYAQERLINIWEKQQKMSLRMGFFWFLDRGYLFDKNPSNIVMFFKIDRLLYVLEILI